MQQSLQRLKAYIEAEQYKGWDPYDGLNSRLFRAIPFLKDIPLCRLAMIQGFKRMPFNLRKLAFVPKEYNAKGIGLILQGYCNLYRAVEQCSEQAKIWGSLTELEEKIIEVGEILVSLKREGYSGACWGYNFDWQARLLFLFPKNTPTVVATSFCATALMEAYEIVQRREWLDIALSAGHFVLKDLHRTPCGNGFIFSYSPLNGNDTVFNASLLGARLLSYCYSYTGEELYRETARRAVLACCEHQAENGAWVYGMLPVQQWIDSFHTGYNLDALQSYQDLTGDHTFDRYIQRGLDYYLRTFFNSEGIPNYYHNQRYPIDIHCPGQLFTTLFRSHRLIVEAELAKKVLDWTVCNMQDREGYFYYQLKEGISSKIPYMRWSNAFMFMALSYYNLGNTTSRCSLTNS